MGGKDYYRILGVSRDVNDKELKTVYRRLARQYHPDVNPGNKTAEAMFKDINQAYEVIADPEKRKKYDKYGDQWQDAEFYEAEREQDGNLNFSRTAGAEHNYRAEAQEQGSTFRPRQTTNNGLDNDYPLEVTLEEAFNGTVRNIAIQTESICPACKGRGRIINTLCSTCRGTGVIIKTKHLQVKIPGGVDSGSRIRLAGKGKISQDREITGDLYLIISVRRHPLFRRKENNLYVDVFVPLTAAVLGGNIQVPTLNGAPIAMKIPPETQNEQVFRLVGHGMPHLGYSSRGDLMITIKVNLPTGLTAEEKALFSKLKNRQS
jgi:DnaJ-class molecular chaperone